MRRDIAFAITPTERMKMVVWRSAMFSGLTLLRVGLGYLVLEVAAPGSLSHGMVLRMSLSERVPTWGLPWARRMALGLLLLLAAISCVIGGRNALRHSQDFQWSGERLLLDHIDPWAEYLRGDPSHRLLETQIPNYLPVFYLLIIPLGLLSLAQAKLLWMLCNFVFATASASLATRFYGLRGAWAAAGIALMLLATPTRNSIGNGQQGLLVLLLWCVSLLRKRMSGTTAAFSGLAYFKFNFAPPQCVYLVLQGGLRKTALSLLPSLLGLSAVWCWLTGGHDLRVLWRIAIEPLQVSQVGYWPRGGGSNMMDVTEALLGWRHVPEALAHGVASAAALVLCCAVSFRAMRRNQEHAVPWQIALMATMSFCLFKHHSYDGVVLLLPLCYALRLRHAWRARLVLLAIGYLWYVQRLLEAAHLHPKGSFVAEFLLLLAILSLIYSLHSYEERTELRPHEQLVAA